MSIDNATSEEIWGAERNYNKRLDATSKQKKVVKDNHSALAVQVGGEHYKDLAIQPMEYSMLNNLNACQHTAIKYITRYKDKGGLQDLVKAKHCIDLLMEFENEQA